MLWRVSFVTLLWIVAIPAPGQPPHSRHLQPHSSEDYAREINDPKRDAWQKPHEVLTALALRPDETIADIGAGTGYFARRFARHAGRVYAVDIDAKLLAAAAQDGPSNLVTVLATTDDPKLPPASIDTIFFCNVLHHVENRAPYYRKLAAALKPGGRLVVIDFYKRPLPVGPPESMKLSEAEVENELKQAGFRRARAFDFLPHQYFLVFERP